MHILCAICSDLVNPAENLYVTKCGHLFHYHCLAQWIQRSKSCPQCRNKVTDRCMFRMYPTVSNENSGEDAATLQSRLDDAMLQLRTQKTEQRALKDQLAAVTQEANKKEELLKATEKRLVSRESTVTALREQVQYVKIHSAQALLLQEENEGLKKSLQTLNGLQKVLNATAGEVEETLRGYSDLRTLATFAAALKRALCESEAKKRSCRELQHGAEQRLAAMRARYEDLQAKLGQVQENLTNMERKYEALKHKRKASGDGDGRDAKHARIASTSASAPAPAPAPAAATAPAAACKPAPAAASPGLGSSLDEASITEKDVSLGTAVQRIVQADSPYLRLKHAGLAPQPRRPAPAPAAGLKPSEFAILRSMATSIFHKPADLDTAFADLPDGFGGHSRPDVFPVPKPKLPKLTSRHKLKKFPETGSRDISQMFAHLRDKD